MQAAGYAYHILWNVFAAYAMIQLFTGVSRVRMGCRFPASFLIPLGISQFDFFLAFCTTAVILENFIEVVTGDSTDQDKFNEFVEVWTKLDPDAGVSFATSGSNVNTTTWVECCLQLERF